MKLIHLIISTTLAVISFASAVQSEELMGFDRASYNHDTVVLSQPQSGGTRLQLEAAVGSYNNELIRTYGSDSAFSRIGKSVGRLDVVTDNGVFPCTAFIVSKKYILTNYHCSTGILPRVGATRIDVAYFVAGYTMTGIDAGTKKYTVIPTPIEFDEDLDYAVLEVLGDPSQDYGELRLASLVPKDGTPFWIIGHPHGEAQRISREKCRAGAPAISRATLLHTCDTLPGNSGSPVIDVGLRQVVALHRAGISNDDVNQAILMSKILENSTVLAAYKAPEDVPKSQPVEPKTAANSACDALYSATAETKECYAYDAYLKSCASHALAPLARGYINEFCQPKDTVKVDKVPEKTCDDDPSLCSTDQLCGQSLTFKSGKAAWRTDNVSYVTEAKRRGMTCGVIEVVAMPKKTCSSDPEVCNNANLCGKATAGAVNNRVWDMSNTWKAHVVEAKRRMLSCGVREVAVKPLKTCSADVASCDDKNLCIYASTSKKGKKVWLNSTHWQFAHVVEAKSRGLACGVTEAVAKPKKTCREDATACSKAELCAEARSYSNGQYSWETRTTRLKHVAEARRRGLPCGITEAVAKNNCFYDVATCSQKEICKAATLDRSGGKIWDKRSVVSRHVAEAMGRGLSCGVAEPSAKSIEHCKGSYKSTWDNCFGTWDDGKGFKYSGQFESGKRKGQGTAIWSAPHASAGFKYIGGWHNNNMSGQRFIFLPSKGIRFCAYYKSKDDSNCIGTNAYDVAVTLKNQFSALPNSQRKAIQSTLKRKGLYASSIDAKWGRRTLMALVKFSSKNLGTVDLQSASASKKLLDAVLR